MPPKDDAVNAFFGLTATQLGSIKNLPAALDPAVAGGLRNAQEVKAVEISFDDHIARHIICNFVNISRRNAAGQAVNTGPIVGIVEWGTGGSLARIEFNLPLAYTWAQNGDIIPTLGSQQGTNGVILTVCGSSIRCMARNESRLPPIFGSQTATIGSNLTLDGQYGAFVAQGSSDKQCGMLERDLIVVTANGDPMEPQQGASFGIPRFAKSVKFFRTPLQTSSLEVILGGDLVGSVVNNFVIPGGTPGFIPISPLHSSISVVNRGAVNITGLYAAFELSL